MSRWAYGGSTGVRGAMAGPGFRALVEWLQLEPNFASPQPQQLTVYLVEGSSASVAGNRVRAETAHRGSIPPTRMPEFVPCFVTLAIRVAGEGKDSGHPLFDALRRSWSVFETAAGAAVLGSSNFTAPAVTSAGNLTVPPELPIWLVLLPVRVSWVLLPLTNLISRQIQIAGRYSAAL